MLKTLAGILIILTCSVCNAGGSVSNKIVTLGISGNNGGSVDSLKVLGNEVLDASDLGRELQASLFLQKTNFYPNNRPGCNSTILPAPWFNPQDGGDMCGNPSVVTGFSTGEGGYINVISQARDWAGVTLWDQNLPSTTMFPGSFTIEGHHKLGPLPYSNHEEAIRLFYLFRLENSSPTASVQFLNNSVTDSAGNVTPTSFVPAIYFKSNVLTRLFGLSMDGQSWVEVNPKESAGEYVPSLYKYRAMAWMRPDLGWGVGVYSRATLNQAINFTSNRYSTLGVNSLNLINQNLGTLFMGQQIGVLVHMAVGNLSTIQYITNEIYNAGQ